MTPEAIELYIFALDDLSAADVQMAFLESARRAHSGFMPTPGEIREALEILKAKANPGRSNADPDCNICGGTGYKLVDVLDPKTNEVMSGYHRVKPCDCLRRARAATA